MLTSNGEFIPYDALLVAVGARVGPAAAGMSLFTRAPEGIAGLAQLIRGLQDGSVKRAALVVPRRAAWPVDGYELAFIARLAAPDAELTVVTAEDHPLESLGTAASEALREELEREGIELISGTEVPEREGPDREGGMDAFSSVIARLSRQRRSGRRKPLRLSLDPEGTLVVDRALAIAVAHGPAVAGLPHDEHGFLPVDPDARLAGSDRVFVAGDATALTVKHSTLASNQGAAAAQAIAAEAGATLEPEEWSNVLYGILALPPHFPGARGSPWLSGGEPVSHCLWWPPGHVAGRYLAHYLAADDAGVRPGLEWHPNGIPVAVRVEAGSSSASAGPVSEDALRQDSLSRQLMAIRRAGREGAHLDRELRDGVAAFERHMREVKKQLEAAGYLRD